MCPQFAIVALLRYRLQVSFAHWTSASPVSRTARGEAPSHWRRPSCASSIRNGRPAAPDGLQFSFAHWAYFALFRAQRARFVRPPPLPPPQSVSAKILRIYGRGNCKETIFALENEIFRRKNRPVPAVHAAGDDCTAKGLRSTIRLFPPLATAKLRPSRSPLGFLTG